MQVHMKTRRPAGHKWPSCLLAIALVVLVGTSNLSEAIVKQQRSDDSSASSSQATGSGQQSQQASSGFNNHKSGSQSSVSSSSSPSQSISVSQSAPVSVVSVSSSQPQGSQASRSDSGSAYQTQQYGSSAASSMPKQSLSSSYGIDNMSAASSNTDQSYQAAANSVNMALANSGIFGSSSQNGNYGQSGAGNSQASSNTAGLNPLHYYYYPAKESGASALAGQSQQAASNKQSIDMINSQSSQNYPSLAAYPMYADQLNGASGSSLANPEVAASNQDPSYMSAAGQQGSSSDLAALYGGQSINAGAGSQQGSSYAGDLSMFSSNLNPATSAQAAPSSAGQQQSGSVSFPSSSGANLGMQQQQPQQGVNQQHQGDYLNSHMGGHQGVYPFNQLGDLSTSNYGNNAGGMSQASYMSPHAQPSEQSQQQQPSQHDQFSLSQQQPQQQPQFSLSASQLNPSAVPPPMSMGTAGQQQQSTGASSLFNTASLFSQQSQPQPTIGSAANTNNNNLLAQQYLNSFLNSPYNQLLGQQSADTSASPSIAQPTGVAPSGSSSKRFGISSFIMPMLALAGLSLLIPTMSNIGTAVGRKKRSIEDKASMSSRQQQIAFDSMNGAGQLTKELSIGEYMDKIERYYSIYKNAVESDDCLNRLICEFGDAVKDVTGKSAVMTVIEKLAPNWMVGKVHLFKEAALDNKEGKEKCRKYVCQSNKRQH